MAKDIKKHVKGLGIEPVAVTGVTQAGEMEVLSTDDNKLQYHNGVDSSPVVTEAHDAVLTNKTISSDDNTIDLELSALRVDLANADKILRRDVNGEVVAQNNILDNSDVVTVDAVQTLTGKVIDGDDNTVQDLPLTALKTDGAADNTVIRRDASGVVYSGNTIPDNTELVTVNANQNILNKTIDIADGNQIFNADVSIFAVEAPEQFKILKRDVTGTVVNGNIVPNDSNIITTDASQTLSNKTLNSPVINTPTGIVAADVGLADVTNDAQLKRAANDFNTFAEKTILSADDILLIEDSDDSGTKKYVKASRVGGSGGDINFLQLSGASWNAEAGVAGFATYKDADSARPVDGTGGSPTVSVTTSSTNPLSGSASLVIGKPASNVRGEGVSANFSIDRANQARVLKVEFDYNVASGTFVAGTTSADSDIIVYLYDVTNNRLIEPSSFKLFSNSTTVADKFSGYFQTSADSLDYRLIFHVATTSAVAFDLRVDNVIVTPSKYVFGTPITDWQSYTPTFANLGTPSDINMRWRRVGSNLEVAGRWTNGTVGGGLATFTIPSGFAVNLPSTQAIGFYGHQGSATNSVLGWNGGSNIYFGMGNWQVGATGTQLTTGAFTTVNLSVPIQGWSSSVRMSDGFEARDISSRIIKTSTLSVAHNTSVLINNFNIVTFDTTTSFNTSTGTFIAPTSGLYDIRGQGVYDGGAGASSAGFVLRYAINGVDIADFARVDLPPSVHNNAAVAFQGTDKVWLNAGDQLQFKAFQNTGVTRNLSLVVVSIARRQSPQTTAQSEVVAFDVRSTSGAAIGTSFTDVIFPTVIDNSHGSYNPSTGEFVANAPIEMQFSWHVATNGGLTLSTTQRFRTAILLNNTIVGFGQRINGGGASTSYSSGGSKKIKLVAGDRVKIQAASDVSTTQITTVGENYFTGISKV